MRVHIFTKIKNTDGWNKKKNVFFSYFTSVIPEFSYMDFFRKCSMFCRSILLITIKIMLKIKNFFRKKNYNIYWRNLLNTWKHFTSKEKI